jgi:hypothetical protein
MSTTHSLIVSRRGTAHELLGDEHPLARAQERTHALIVQSIGVSALAAFIGLAWLVEPDGRYAVALVAAAVVQAVLALALVPATSAKRDAVLRLVAEGRGELPLATVERMRRRLVRPQRRERLARSLDALRREAARPLRGPLPLYSRRVVGSVDPELARVAGLLREPHISPDGVARAHLLLSSESSTLYGDDAEQLRRELGRLTFALGYVRHAHGAS